MQAERAASGLVNLDIVGLCRLTVLNPMCLWFQRLKLKHGGLLSSFAFKLNLRRYDMVIEDARPSSPVFLWVPMVGRCRLTLSNPR